MFPEFLIPLVKDFKFGADRSKVSGRMWGGGAHAKMIEGVVTLKLWYHGGDHETYETLLPKLSMEGVCIGQCYYDAYWHCLWDHNSIWLHRDGWFGFQPEAERIKAMIPQVNHRLQQRILPVKQMIEMGFVKLK